MKAPAQLDDGGALSVKKKFVNLIKFGSHNKEIEDYKEVGERLLTWAKIRCEPIEAYQNHMGTLYKPLQAIESREKRRDISQPRPTKRIRDDSEDMQKRQARSRERSASKGKITRTGTRQVTRTRKGQVMRTSKGQITRTRKGQVTRTCPEETSLTGDSTHTRHHEKRGERGDRDHLFALHRDQHVHQVLHILREAPCVQMRLEEPPGRE